MIFAVYEADLTTRMTVQDQNIAIRTFEDIANSEHQVVALLGTSSYNLMKFSDPESPLKRIFATIEGNPDHELPPDCKVPCRNKLLNVIISQIMEKYRVTHKAHFSGKSKLHILDWYAECQKV